MFNIHISYWIQKIQTPSNSTENVHDNVLLASKKQFGIKYSVGLFFNVDNLTDNHIPLPYFSHTKHTYINEFYFAVASGFRKTRITESPRRNILEIYLSLFTGLDFFLPFPVFGTSVHISLTFSSTMLQCL